MKKLTLTNHAEKRSRQRGISQESIDFIFCNGTAIEGRGCQFLFLGADDIKSLSRDPRIDRKILERCKKVYLVVEGSTIITTAHRLQRFKQDYWH